MKDYEQMYYDLLYEYKQVLKKIKKLEQEIEIYKSLQNNKNIKEIIIKDFIKYINKKEV